jgi:hypothetical protein
MLAATVRLQNHGLEHLSKQRDADRCWHRVLSERCGRLSRISFLNQRLKEIAVEAAGLKALMVIPAVGAAAKTSHQFLKAAAQAMARIQDGLVQGDQGWVVLGPALCGAPLNVPVTFSTLVKRQPTALATAAEVPPPLTWVRPLSTSIVTLLSRQGPRTGGQCMSAVEESLSGESYSATLLLRPVQDRSSSRVSSSLPSWLPPGFF